MSDEESPVDATSVDEFPADEDPTNIEGWHTPRYTQDGPLAYDDSGDHVRFQPDGSVLTITDDARSWTDATDQTDDTRYEPGAAPTEATPTEDIYEG
jgi:hypothetical protein